MLLYPGQEHSPTTFFDYSINEDENGHQRGDLISWNFEPGWTSYWVLIEEDENGMWKIARTSNLPSMDNPAEKGNITRWNPGHTGLTKIHKCKATGFDVQVGQRWTTQIRGRSRQMIVKEVTGELVVAELCRKTRTQDIIHISKSNLLEFARRAS